MSKILNASMIVFVAAFAGLLIPTNNNIGTAEAQNEYYDEYEQEYYPEYDNSYYQEDQTGYGNYEKDYYPTPGKLTVKKELFQCFNPTGVTTSTPNACFEFEQTQPGQPFTSKVVPPNSPLYKNCDNPGVDCRYDTEDFVIDVINGEKITSNPQGVELKLSGKEYFVEEDDIRTDYAVEKSCKNSGYDQGGVVGNGGVLHQTGVCIIYEGDCDGQLNPGDNKVCTVKNYLPVASPIQTPP